MGIELNTVLIKLSIVILDITNITSVVLFASMNILFNLY